MNPWPKDNTHDKRAFYGDFNQPHWADLNLIHYLPPFMMHYGKVPMIHGMLVHRKIIPALVAVFGEIWATCHQSQSAVDELGASDFGGCFNIRRIAGSDNWSNHSWACALDLSPNTNGFNTGHGTMSPVIIAAFKKQGFRWGGDYHGRTDPMHFEAVSPA